MGARVGGTAQAGEEAAPRAGSQGAPGVRAG